MSHDISQPVPQGGNGAQDAENSRIAAIADELERLCTIHEAQLRDSQADVSHFEAEQRAANAHPATQIMIDTYMAALGFEKTTQEGRFSNGAYEVWDLVPRNVLVDEDGDIFVVDAEIKHIQPIS